MRDKQRTNKGRLGYSANMDAGLLSFAINFPWKLKMRNAAERHNVGCDKVNLFA